MNLKKIILIIDKDYQKSLFLKELFVDEFDILFANDENSIKDLISNSKEDLAIILVSDVFISNNKTNKNLLDIIKKEDIPLLGIINKKDSNEEKELLDFGITDHIYQPFMFENVYNKVVDIIREKKAQNQLQTIMDNVTGGVLLLEVGEILRCLYVNKGFFNFSGYSEENYHRNTQADIAKYIFFDDEAFVKEQLLQAVKDNAPFSFDFRATIKEDEIKWFYAQGTPIKNNETINPVVLVLLTDITKLKSAEVELARTSSQLAMIIENLNCGIAIFALNEGLELLYGNGTLSKLMGLRKEEIHNMPSETLLTYVHSEDIENFRKCLKEASLERTDTKIDIRFVKGNAGINWVRLNAEKISEGNNGVLVYGIFLDINNEKAQEEHTQKTTDELKYRANYDLLTGIYNKTAFCNATYEMLKAYPQKKYSLVLWNIEQFKIVNDLLGIKTGDTILRIIANRLASTLSGQGTYARAEADHFVTCFPNDLFDVEKILKDIQDSIGQLQLRNQIRIIAGIYEIDDINIAVEQMCDRAGLAMQTIKSNFVRNFAYYDDKLRLSLVEEREIISEMMVAIENHEFTIYLQPIYSLVRNEVIGAEALARWIHPQKGVISPAVFIPVFERNGFISKLDFYIWEEACRYLRKRKNDNLQLIPISVNVSRLSLYNSFLCEEAVELVDSYEIDHNLLRFEITETAYNDNPVQLLATLSKMKKQGFKIMMDDFGSGYSSLNALKEIPIDIIKMDMKFLEGVKESNRADSILISIVRMAKWLDNPVIAEGVEKITQLHFLKSIGCDRIQGYLISPPLPVDQFDKFIKTNPKIQTNEAPIQLVADQFDLGAFFSGNPILTYFLDNIASGVGVYEFHKENLIALRVNNAYYDIMGYNKETFLQDSKVILQRIYEEDRKKIIDACKKVIKNRRPEKLLFRRYRTDNVVIWLDSNINFLGGTKEKPLISIAISDVTSSVQDRKLLSYQEETIMRSYRFLAKLYDTIPCGIVQFSLSIKTQAIAANQSACKMLGYANEKDFVETIGKDLTKLVIEEETKFINKQMFKELSEGKQIYFDARFKRKNGSLGWYRITIYQSTNVEGIEVIQGVFVDFSEEKNKLMNTKENISILNRSLDFLKVGVVCWEQDNKIKIVLLNKKMSEMFGYSHQEYCKMFSSGKIDGNIKLSDLNFNNQELIKLQSSEEKIVELTKKDNSKIIVKINLSADTSGEQIIYQATVIDITKEYQENREVNNKVELYENLLCIPQSYIFDYNIKTKVLKYYIPDQAENEDVNIVENFHAEVVKCRKIHEDYLKEFTKIFLKKYQQETSDSLEFLAAFNKQEFNWYRISYKVIANKISDGFRIIGSICNVHTEVEKAIRMKERAQKDIMSGLYNRAVTEELIKNKLCEMKRSETFTFYMIDIDQFKEINDEHGHLVGDRLILKIANMLKQEFNSKAIIGRLGGDEFAVLSMEENSEEKAIAKAEDILQATRDLSKTMNVKLKITTSVGIAFAPRDGKTFKTLFMNADKAMYKAKNEGKDCCKIYQN
ncbi:MAG: EAL domain-containing protein [Bacilli bacterium]